MISPRMVTGGGAIRHLRCATKRAWSSQGGVQVPPAPAWSVRDLRLDPSFPSSHDKISNEELTVLARRCLIDVSRLSTERRDRLRTDIAGVMRCASVLLESKSDTSELTDAAIYDSPRGLSKTPVRVACEDTAARICEDQSITRTESVRRKMNRSHHFEVRVG